MSRSPQLHFRPLTPRLMDDLGTVLRGSWGTGCWCMYPRLTEADMKEMRGPGLNQRRCDAMTKLARRRRAPGLLAFEGDEPVGWVAIAPRTELNRIETSRATPRVDDEDVWVIPCITVRPTARGRGIALALMNIAVPKALTPNHSTNSEVHFRVRESAVGRYCLTKRRQTDMSCAFEIGS